MCILTTINLYNLDIYEIIEISLNLYNANMGFKD